MTMFVEQPLAVSAKYIGIVYLVHTEKTRKIQFKQPMLLFSWKWSIIQEYLDILSMLKKNININYAVSNTTLVRK